MADDVDLTAAREEREAPLRLAASRRPEGPAPTGWCLNCDAELGGDGRRWCDAECLQDWQLDQTRRGK